MHQALGGEAGFATDCTQARFEEAYSRLQNRLHLLQIQEKLGETEPPNIRGSVPNNFQLILILGAYLGGI